MKVVNSGKKRDSGASEIENPFLNLQSSFSFRPLAPENGLGIESTSNKRRGRGKQLRRFGNIVSGGIENDCFTSENSTQPSTQVSCYSITLLYNTTCQGSIDFIITSH